jgi:hypothetical protein
MRHYARAIAHVDYIAWYGMFSAQIARPVTGFLAK